MQLTMQKEALLDLQQGSAKGQLVVLNARMACSWSDPGQLEAVNRKLAGLQRKHSIPDGGLDEADREQGLQLLKARNIDRCVPCDMQPGRALTGYHLATLVLQASHKGAAARA